MCMGGCPLCWVILIGVVTLFKKVFNLMRNLSLWIISKRFRKATRDAVVLTEVIKNNRVKPSVKTFLLKKFIRRKK